jgi:phosphate-selective porin
VSLTAGMFNNPFGYEVTFSSSVRESPERGRMSQTLFPNEREVGAMITLQGPSKSKWNWITLNAGFFNGNSAPGFGVDVSDFDSKKDFSGRLGIERKCMNDKITYGAGVSYYQGGFRIDSVTVYKKGSDENGVNGFVIDSRAIENGLIPIKDRKFTNRIYMGADARISLYWKGGTTTLRGEFITGDQPGSSISTRSPNDRNPISRDVYQRNFNGAYFYFVQDILKTPLQVVVKYDWYDPNTSVEGDEVGKAVSSAARATNETDLRYDTYGFGLNYHFDKHVRISAYYDVVKNETTTNLVNFTKDRPDNVFTLRLQVKI